MSYPMIDIDERHIILLSGLEETTLVLSSRPGKGLKKPPRSTAMRPHLVTFQANGSRQHYAGIHMRLK